MATKKTAAAKPTPEATSSPVPAPLPEAPRLDLDSASDTVSTAQMDAILGASVRKVNKPDISRLPDGIVCGKPVFGPGDKIVIERYAGCLIGHPYLDTRTYRVREVNLSTGGIKLWDEEYQQHATDNFLIGLKLGQVYKLANGLRVAVGQKKRGRPRKNPIEVAKPVELGPDGKPIKKKRGRPAGSKNRPKEEIKADKAAKSAARAAKKKLTPKKRTKKGA